MQSPSHHTGHPDVHTSDAATPGASVTAQRGGGNSVLDTPGPPSPGQASPARHRSLEGSRTQQHEGPGGRPPSRGRSAGLEAAAAALGTADSAPQAPPEPLSKPRLRVQGADIILEDAASPRAAALTPAPAPAAAGGSSRQLAAAMAAAASQQQQQQGLQGLQQHVAVAARASQSHEHELQLRLASRSAGNMATPSGRPVAAGGDDRLRGAAGGTGASGAAAAGGDAGPGGGAAAAAAEGPVRIKYRSTLTEENVAYLNKLDQYARQDSTGRSSERIWRWLETSGPPFDNPPPSLGVPTASKTNQVAANRRQAGKRRGFLSCFNCFGGSQ